MFEVSSYMEQQNDTGDDSLYVRENEDSIWFCISDGAGGTGCGAKASAYIVEAFKNITDVNGFHEPDDFEKFLRKIDLELSLKNHGGEATAIVGKIENEIIIGASVGDSEAWIYNQEYDFQLTLLQNIKPLIGSGQSTPIGFGPIKLELSVLLGSDGLFKYTRYDEIKTKLHYRAIAAEIAVLAKKETGKLQDDLSIILIRKKSP